MNNQILQGEKYLWRLPDVDNRLVADIAASYNLSFPIVQTLFSRGFKEKDAIDSFLFTTYERDVAHPSRMKDAQKAVDRILHAINNQEKILVFGDYDVDGITSSSLMMISLLPLGAQVNFYLPHRVKDGYGLSTKVVERAASNGYKVIITVDNGISAFEPALRAKELGIDLIITDHHRPHDHVPEAYAIVNPNQSDCPYPFKVLAGVGVSFKLLSLLYEMKKMQLPAKAYELLLLGTVADVVPLLGENRYWVRHGLNYVNQYESLALRVLKQNGKVVHERISSTDVGFSLAPQINALGRLEDPRQGVGFLIGSNEKDVEHTGKILLELNEARKEIERSIYNHVVHEIQSGNIDLSIENVIVAASDSWPPGVIGLVAGRLMNAYGKPTILLHLSKNGIAKGSCRSIPEFNMFNALQANKDLLLNFGGHSMAAGLGLKIENVPLLKARLESMVREQLTEFDLKQKLVLDASARLSDFNQKFMADLNHLEPFGNSNSVPVFYLPDVVCVQKPQLLKDAHVKCSVFADGVIKQLMFFNRPDLFEKLMAVGENSFSLAAQVKENHWNGRTNIELMGTDISFKK